MAYSCDLLPLLPNNSIAVDSFVMCEYVRYHIVIFLLFGSLSVFLICIALALSTCYGRDPTQTCRIQQCVKWALNMLVLSLGFECVLLAVYIACFICLSISILRFLML